MRLSLKALEGGDNLLIFPENTGAEGEIGHYHLDGVGKLYDGFVLTAQLYYKHTGKRLTFISMIIRRDTKRMLFGPGITYDPENGSKEERTRISEEAYKEMIRLYEKASSASARKFSF